METLITLARGVAWVLSGGLIAIVAYQLLTGVIRLDGLFRDKSCDCGLCPFRIQSFAFSVLGGLTALRSLGQPADPDASLTTYPVVAAVAASHGLYLWRKQQHPSQPRTHDHHRADTP